MFRTIGNKCEHCNTKRGRKETFILRTPEGALIQIGRNCLADFLATDPAQMVASAEFVSELGRCSEEESYWGSAGGWDVDPLKFVAAAISACELDGFIKSTSYVPDGKMTTKEFAAFISGPRPWHPVAAEDWKAAQPTAEQKERAKEVIDWAAGLSSDETRSDYMWNLHLAVKQLSVGKNGGLLASAPSAYDRELGKRAENAQKSKTVAKGYVKPVGEVWEGPATLVRRNITDGQYGSVAICTFRTDDAHEVVWFASGKDPGAEGISKRFMLKGRVKRCENRKGVDQTVITRASFKAIA
jgi:hypothetical protein